MVWRTVSTTGTPTSVKQPHNGRLSSRLLVRVHAAFLNPHSLLGVNPTADVKEVKRAYRKLALQLHPDVCKSEDGHERFIALTQAYEMLLGRAEGKTNPNHASSSGWDFHDWYWNFRMQRSREKQQRQAKAAADGGCAGSSTETGFGRRPPPHGQAGFRQPEARANLRSQLAGLRHRAAVRANRPATAPPPPTSSPPASPSSWFAASGCSMDAVGPWAASATATAAAAEMERDAGDSARHGAAASSSDPSSPDAASSAPGWSTWSWSWSWDDMLESEDDEQSDAGATTTAADDSNVIVAGNDNLNGCQGSSTVDLNRQYPHVYDATATAAAAARCGLEAMAMHDGHLGTVVGAANHAVPFPRVTSSLESSDAFAKLRYSCPPQHQTQHHPWGERSATIAQSYRDQTPHEADLDEPEPEPFSNPFDKGSSFVQGQGDQQQYGSARRRFAANGASREAVSRQLAGLRRKAAMKAAHFSGASDAASGDDDCCDAL